MKGTLYLAASPIGNLKDITLRVLETMQKADLIVAEDTRRTRKLLAHFNFHKPLISYHQHSSSRRLRSVIEELKKGKNIIFLTDAGTPGISDPGAQLVAKAYRDNISVMSLPGPSALTAAVSLAGFPLQDFLFLAFLPKKKGKQTLLRRLAQEKRAFVFFESPQRIGKTLKELSEFMPEAQIVIARELTKIYEEVIRGIVKEVANDLQKRNVKGEITVIVKP